MLVAQGVSFVVVLVALVVCFSHLFANSAAFANKMGLQRMRTQRTLKEALCVRHRGQNLSVAALYDPAATLRKIERVQRRFRRRTKRGFGRLMVGSDASRGLDRALERDSTRDLSKLLAAYLLEGGGADDGDASSDLDDDELDKWTALDAQAERVVDDYTTAISSLSNLSTAYLWVAVALNVGVFAFTVYLQLKIRAEERRLAACDKEIAKVLTNLDARAFEAEVLNHRFGNKIRVNRLLLECGHYERLKKNFDAWTWEVEIRRGHFDNLPLAPVSARDLFDSEFAFPHSLRCFCGDDTPLTFKSRAGDRQLSFAVIQHSFLQDLASNIIKYGGSRADVVVRPDAIVVSNDIVPSAVGLPKTRKTGLVALQRLGEVSGTPISVEKTDARFTLTIHCRIEPAARLPEHSVSGDHHPKRYRPSEEAEDDEEEADAKRGDSEEEERVPVVVVLHPDGVAIDADSDADKSRRGRRRPDPKAFHWMLLEDSPTICALTAKKVRDRFGIALATLPKASDAFNLVSIVLEAHHLHEKPIILIMDENVVTLNAMHRCVGETSTNLRKTLRKHPDVRRLLADDQLFFVSASASEVADDALLCKVGKTLGTEAQVAAILDAVGAHVAAAAGRRATAGAAPTPSLSSSASSTTSSSSSGGGKEGKTKGSTPCAKHPTPPGGGSDCGGARERRLGASDV